MKKNFIRKIPYSEVRDRITVNWSKIHLVPGKFHGSRKVRGEGMSSVTLFYTSPSLNPSDGWLVVAPELIEARTSDSLIAKVFASSRLSIC